MHASNYPKNIRVPLHQPIACCSYVEKLKVAKMFTPYHAILFGIILITSSISIFQIAKANDGLILNQRTSAKNKFNLDNH